VGSEKHDRVICSVTRFPFDQSVPPILTALDYQIINPRHATRLRY
jgi:hypothetical protein